MQGKGEFSKVKRSTCNLHIETVKICNNLQKPVVSNGLIEKCDK